uniref:C-type lectin domain-containing protein n=1 Tax=Fundulus heteroclitus TaxID=8078 RepID=A0A3Q2P6I2_FUNHE
CLEQRSILGRLQVSWFESHRLPLWVPEQGPYFCSDLFKDETCQKCEAGWELHGGNCYKFSTMKSSWNESRDSCKDLGGDLVKIDSREEQV